MCDRFFSMMICLFLLADPDWLQTEQHSAEFVGTVTSHLQMRYLLFTPKAYENAGGKKWPLIVYLPWRIASRKGCRAAERTGLWSPGQCRPQRLLSIPPPLSPTPLGTILNS